MNIPPRFKASGKHGETYKHATAMECLVGLHTSAPTSLACLSACYCPEMLVARMLPHAAQAIKLIICKTHFAYGNA